MKTDCYKLASALWQKKGYKRKDFGLTHIFGNDYLIELPDLSVEKSGHCAWCCLFEVLSDYG